MADSYLNFSALWDRALTYQEFVRQSTEHCALWTGVYRLARIPDWAVAGACERGVPFRLLVLAEDWCGDASNTIPYVAKLGDLAHCLEMRILRRDEHPEVMDRYLTGTSRSIPIVIVLDEQFREVGHWGSRPAELQAWVMTARRTTPKEELYPQIRRWYAKDKGVSTLREILALLPERASVAPGRADE
jgi:Thioredoxin